MEIKPPAPHQTVQGLMDKFSGHRRKELAQIEGKRRIQKGEVSLPVESMPHPRDGGKQVEGVLPLEDKLMSRTERPLRAWHWARFKSA